MATSTFLAWANGANIESDAQWSTDPLRTGNIPVDAALPSPMLNKLFRQATVFNAAFGQALAAKGYSTSDASQNTLAAVLANIITEYDLAHSPALGGNPTATTQSGSDNSSKVATTAFVQGVVAAVAALIAGAEFGSGPNGWYLVLPALGTGTQLIIQFGEVSLFPGTNGPFGWPLGGGFPNACLAMFTTPAGDIDGNASITSFSTWQFLLYATTSFSCFWLAIGY